VGLALTHVPKTAYNRGLFADPAGGAFARAPGQGWGTRWSSRDRHAKKGGL